MRRVIIVGAALLASAGVGVGVFATSLEGSERFWPLVWLVWAPVGAFILLRRPGNGVGRSMLAIGLLWGLSFLAFAMTDTDLPLEVRVWADLSASLLGVVAWLGIVWLILVFPSGHLEGWLARASAFGFVLVGSLGVYSFAVSTQPLDGTGLPSPVADDDPGAWVTWFVSDSGFLLVIGLVVLAVLSIGLRWYRSDGVERHQYRWLLLGALVFVGVLAAGQLLPEVGFAAILWLIGGTAIPISVGVAITRYRLYEIDRILSRTVAYAIVVVVLGVLFALGVVAVPNAIIGSGSAPPIVVAATTLLVATLFNPVRRLVLMWVDRRFNRSRFKAERVMDDFGRSLRDRTDLTALLDDWIGVVGETMQPAALGVWVREGPIEDRTVVAGGPPS